MTEGNIRSGIKTSAPELRLLLLCCLGGGGEDRDRLLAVSRVSAAPHKATMAVFVPLPLSKHLLDAEGEACVGERLLCTQMNCIFHAASAAEEQSPSTPPSQLKAPSRQLRRLMEQGDVLLSRFLLEIS